MFEVNAKKFGVHNTFTMDQYTTPLPDAATQAKILEQYEVIQALRKKSTPRNGKGHGNGRRHSADSPSTTSFVSPKLVPAVADMFAAFSKGSTVPEIPSSSITPQNPQHFSSPITSNQLEKKVLSCLDNTDFLISNCNSNKPCGAYAATSFSFNRDDILGCM